MESLIYTIYGLTQFIWAVPLVVLMCFGVRMYKITNGTYLQSFYTRIKDNSIISLNGDRPEGLFAGKWFIGYAGSDVTLISTRAKFIELTGHSDSPIILTPAHLPVQNIIIFTR